MQVKRIAECSKWSILQYFRPLLSYHLSLRFLCLFLSGRLTQVLLQSCSRYEPSRPHFYMPFGLKIFEQIWKKGPPENHFCSCFFVWFDSLRPITNLSVSVFLPGWNSTTLRLIFLLKDTTQWRRWGLNPRPLGLESSTLPLSHCLWSLIKSHTVVSEENDVV